MNDPVALIEKYKARLDTQYGFKKVFRALQKLNEIDMTVELLQNTGVGRAVHKLRKEKGFGEFARDIVAKWKKIVNRGIQTNPSPQKETAYSGKVKSEPQEYDPANNWNAPSSSSHSPPSYQPARSVKQETTEEEYDPSQNWQMEGVQTDQSPPAYEPFSNPTRVKKETVSSKSKKKKKSKEQTSSHAVSGRMHDSSSSASKSYSKVKDSHEYSNVKVESVSSARYLQSKESSEEEVEEYDPSSNFELSNSPPVNYDPESDHETHEDYEPGPSNVIYTPSSSKQDHDWANEENDSEESYQDDEPGAYLLHPRKPSGEYGRRYSNHESDPEENPSDSFVHATTLYSRNKSVDSEDGMWGSKVNGMKRHQDVNLLPGKKVASNNPSSSEASHEEAKSVKRREKHSKVKIKTEKVAEKSKSHEKSKKRKSEDSLKNEKKKSKSSKSEVRESSFLFENLPEISKATKKKKSKPAPSTVKPEAKLNLHLPKIQTNYRPLPQTDMNSLKRKDTVLTDNQAAELHSKRQTKKMLVYSGGGGGFLPKMMSLFDQSMAVLMNNIDAIDSFGGVPFEIVNPILKKCTPEQLYRLEDSNPYLLEDTDSLWYQHCVHDFRGKRPEEMESWREMYLRLSDERERKLASLTQMISMKEAKKKPLEKKVMLAYVGANAKPPRNVRRAQEKYGTAGRSRPPCCISSRSSTSAARRDLVESRMSVPVGSITAASVDRENRVHQVREIKKPRIAPMMAKTLKSISKTRYRR